MAGGRDDGMARDGDMITAVVPGYLDRYPAKMVSRLADRLIHDYCAESGTVLDPFCGSGAVLVAAQRQGRAAIGWDVNPYAVLLAGVKTSGFNGRRMLSLAEAWVGDASDCSRRTRETLEGLAYWFTPATLDFYRRLRATGSHLGRSREGRAVLLAYALSVRRCSRADQRSPKPFISGHARSRRGGRYFDPGREIVALARRLAALYRGRRAVPVDVTLGDSRSLSDEVSASYVVTSPPYLNAQDYFRNSKLELALLEGLLPFGARAVSELTVGSDRGAYSGALVDEAVLAMPFLRRVCQDLRATNPREAWVLARYFLDMQKVFERVDRALSRSGRIVLVCGDNVIGGRRVPTWRLLNTILRERGFRVVHQSSDRIRRRYLAPRRLGHEALIEAERVTVFERT